MKEFWTLFKYEFKMQTPFFRKKGKLDISGGVFSFLIVAFLVYVAVVFIKKVLQNYIVVEIDKIYQPVERAKELLTVLYLLVLLAMTVVILERTRKVFADDKNKQVFLRLPLRKRNVFLSKFAVLLIHTYGVGLVCILTINIIVNSVLPLGTQFWLATVAVCVFMPMICLLLVSLLIVPYIMVIELLLNKYSVLFILFTVVLAIAFMLYSQVLTIVQTLLTTGSIRFLFNSKFVGGMQTLYNNAYPISALVKILFEKDALLYWLILLLSAFVSMLIVFVVSKNLYKITLYRQPRSSIKVKKSNDFTQSNTVLSLVKKEFICVYRQPKHIFSYFSVAMSMPIMVYFSFTLFDTLIFNTIGIRINFALALSTILLFGVLTNTFCSTNITRDGLAILKMKTLPLSVSKIFWAKVLFCAIVSSLAIIVSCIVLIIATPLEFFDGLICLLIGLTFTFAQIFIATRLDLNHVRLSMSDMESEDHSSKTLAKVVLIGGILTLIASASSVFFALFAGGLKVLTSTKVIQVCIYLIPTVIGGIYLVCGFLYFRTNILKSFERLAND